MAAQYIGTIEGLNSKFKKGDPQIESLQGKLELALKALADATAKFIIGSEAKKSSVLSSDFIRSSDGEKLAGSKATSEENDANMMHESGCEDEGGVWRSVIRV